jgi:hypothetical protein
MSGKFDDLFGIVKATHSVSLEEMEQAISEQASIRFINAVDDENPEWTEAMFTEAKTAAELLPHLIDCNNEAVESFKRGWQEIQCGEYHPIETLWDDSDL